MTRGRRSRGIGVGIWLWLRKFLRGYLTLSSGFGLGLTCSIKFLWACLRYPLTCPKKSIICPSISWTIFKNWTLFLKKISEDICCRQDSTWVSASGLASLFCFKVEPFDNNTIKGLLKLVACNPASSWAWRAALCWARNRSSSASYSCSFEKCRLDEWIILDEYGRYSTFDPSKLNLFWQKTNFSWICLSKSFGSSFSFLAFKSFSFVLVNAPEENVFEGIVLALLAMIPSPATVQGVFYLWLCGWGPESMAAAGLTLEKVGLKQCKLTISEYIKSTGEST